MLSVIEKARVKYRLLAKTPLFRSGIKRIRDGSCHKSIALMCAERTRSNAIGPFLLHVNWWRPEQMSHTFWRMDMWNHTVWR